MAVLTGAGEGELLVAEDEGELAQLGAELVARAVDEAVRDRGVARIALSGGSTPGPTYRALAELALPWPETEWFQVDERAGPADGPRSNFRQAVEALGFAARGVPSARVHRMEAEREDLAAAARDYERALRASFGVAAEVAFDAIVLGVGDDGHTASLFPGTGSVGVDDRLVTAAPAPGGLEPRLTLTAPVLLRARLLLVLCRGEAKRDVVRRARGAGDEEEIPARLLRRARGRVVWLLDRAAAG